MLFFLEKSIICLSKLQKKKNQKEKKYNITPRTHKMNPHKTNDEKQQTLFKQTNKQERC